MNAQSDHILKNPSLVPALMYSACDHCLYVDNKLIVSKRICPNCGRKGIWRLFQKYSVQYFLELVQRLYIKDEPQAVVLIVCAMLERLLEDLLVQIMRKHKLSEDEIDRKLSASRRLDDRARDLFKEYAKLTLAQAIEAIPSNNFWKTWDDQKKKRDKFIHGSAAAIRANDARDAFELAIDAQSVFCQLHNKYCLIKLP